MVLPLELGWLLFIPLESNLIAVYTLASSIHKRNFEHIDYLLETTSIINIDQYAPDIGINIPLGLVV